MHQGDGTTMLNREKRVKSFLDACAYLLLRDNAEDTLSHYKEMMRGKTEIPVSSCPPSVAHMVDGSQFTPAEESLESERFELMMDCLLETKASKTQVGKRKKEHLETRSQRIERVRQKHPGCTFDFCPVDTENGFTYRGDRYAIDKSVEDYLPIETKHGLWYGSDQVVIVTEPDGTLFFYTQQFHRINESLVQKLS